MILEIATVVVLALLLYILLEYVDHIIKLRRYPPGPFPLPVIGNFHQMGFRPHETFRDLAKKYGDVFSISLGMQRVVVVNRIEPAREALITKGSDFAGRPTTSYTIEILSRGYTDFIFADYGPLWALQRKLAHAALKMYGDGTGNYEAKVIVESEDLHAKLREADGKPVDVQMMFGFVVLNVICSMLFDKRYNDVENEEFVMILRFCSQIVASFSNGDLVAYLPWLRFFPVTNFKALKESLALKDKFVLKKIIEHKETFDPDHIRDFTDSLIQLSTDEEVWQNVGLKKVTDDHLENILGDIFVAGIETTTTAFMWLVVYLLHWPRVQDEIYDEIIRVVGTERYPELKDRPRLPLCQATIQEAQRLASIIPLGLPHRAIKNSSIGGVTLQKNTQVLFNFWNMQHDPSEWSDPETFDPHRWLDDEGKYFPGKHKSFLPFSAGRRGCIGESLAKTELFVILTRCIRDFKFEANTEEAFPNLVGRLSVTLAPHPFTAIFVPRKL